MNHGKKLLLSRFPEEFYPVHTNKEAYYKRLVDGYNRMKKSSVIIAGLARNIEENFCSLVARLETLGELFYQYGILIYENDSTDKTPSYLTTWSIENPHVKFCSEILNFEMLSDTSQKRLQQMAYARNRLHEMIKRCIPPTYIILVDTDLAGGFSYDGVAHSISYENFDCIGANSFIYKDGKRLYYDTFALELGEEVENKNLLVYNRGQALVPVESVFGGLAIYPYSSYMCGAVYREWGCDHVTFHREMKQLGKHKIYLNPSLITSQTKLL